MELETNESRVDKKKRRQCRRQSFRKNYNAYRIRKKKIKEEEEKQRKETFSVWSGAVVGLG